MLNKLYQDSGQWSKSLETCENNDRIHLRNTYYNYAKVCACPLAMIVNLGLFELSY